MPLASSVSNMSRELCAVRWFTVLLFVAAWFVSPLVTVGAQQPATYAERALFDAANRERIAQGLQALHWDDALANAAREHVIRMAQRNMLSHQFPGELPLQDRARLAGARYTVIAENVAEGPSPDMIHSSWMHSPPHRANLLAPELTALGVAVAVVNDKRTGAATLFAVQDFSQSVASLSLEQQERQVSSLLAARGLAVSDARVGGAAEDARKTCQMERGWAGIRPGLVVRYEAADLTRLPDDLEQKVRSGPYRTAAVGACQTGSDGGFARFRIAVLLF